MTLAKLEWKGSLNTVQQTMVLEPVSHPKVDAIAETLRERGWSCAGCGAICGLVGGIAAPALGSVLTAISWLTGATWGGFHVQRAGTILLFLTVPLLLLGAHCLDLLDRELKDR